MLNNLIIIVRACFICQLCQNCTWTVSKWDNGYRVPFYPFLWQTHFRLLRYKRDIISISKREKSVRFSGKLIPDFPVSSLMFCGYQGVTDRHDQSVDWTADLYREICGGRSKMNPVIGK